MLSRTNGTDKSWCSILSLNLAGRQAGNGQIFYAAARRKRRPSTDWLRPTHMRKGNLLYTKSTKFSVSPILKVSSQQSTPVFDQTAGHHGLVKLRHRINPHACQPVVGKWPDLYPPCYQRERAPLGTGAESCTLFIKSKMSSEMY